MDRSIDLVACIPNSRVFDSIDPDIFDGFYLGNPYCLQSEGNFLVNRDALMDAVDILHKCGKKAYLTTPAIPKGKDLPIIKKSLAAAAAIGIDGIEAHDAGIFRVLRKDHPDIQVHVGNFANVYNEKAASLFKRLGASRIVPSHELTGEELSVITGVAGIEFERPVHGPLPVGMAYACLLRRHPEMDIVDSCRQQCASEHFMELDGWRMRSVGTALLTGEDYCLIEHLISLINAGVAAMRLETYFDAPAKINKLGSIYRQALNDALVGRSARAKEVEAARALAPSGLCNGWHFGRSGREYVGADEAIEGAEISGRIQERT